jgi:hypothetical protein
MPQSGLARGDIYEESHAPSGLARGDIYEESHAPSGLAKGNIYEESQAQRGNAKGVYGIIRSGKPEKLNEEMRGTSRRAWSTRTIQENLMVDTGSTDNGIGQPISTVSSTSVASTGILPQNPPPSKSPSRACWCVQHRGCYRDARLGVAPNVTIPNHWSCKPVRSTERMS